MSERDRKVILASQSQSRRAILEAAGVPFEAMPGHVDEDELKASMRGHGATARSIADALAEVKALKVSKRQPQALVVGADQILSLDDGRQLDKASSVSELREHLRALRGRAHLLTSAVVVAEAGTPVWRFVDTAKLQMRAFSDAFLDDYLARTGEAVLSSVGGYHLEGLGAQLFARISGDYFTILGLPLMPLLDYLRTREALPS